MVKDHDRRTSYSDGESEYYSRPKHRRKHRSRSPEVSHKRHKKHHHRSRSDSPEEEKPKIKQEPVSSDSDSESYRRQKKHHIKRAKIERDEARHGSHDLGHGGRERREQMVRVKQEPDSEDELRQQRAERRHNDQRRRENRQKREHLSEHQRYGRREDQENTAANEAGAQPKDQPNFELSGKLTEDTNTYKGVVIKYNEPPEARKPKKRWRLYPFKNDEALKPFHMHRQSAYLFGRERLIADIPIDHPSCSKQHAVYQYRMVPYERDGRKAHKIAPYIIDLESANGTFVNNKRIEPRRYVELMEKDVLKFGFSSREYVLLHDKSNTTEVESDESD